MSTSKRRSRTASPTSPSHDLRFEKALLSLAKRVNSRLDAFLKRVTAEDARTIGVERVSVWLFNAGKSEIVCETLYMRSSRIYTRGARLQASDYPSYFRALQKRRTIAADDARTDSKTREFTKDYLEPFGITSMMDVPIHRLGRVVGIVCHEHTGPKRKWSVEEQDFAASIADLIALALEASERRKAEDSLQQTQGLYRLIAANAPIVLFATDARGVFTLVDGKGLKNVGLKPNELVGQSIFDLYRDDPQIRRMVQRVLAGETLEESVEVQAGPGAGRTYELYYAPVKDKRRRVIGATGVANDITERKEAEQRLHFMAYHDSLTELPNRLLFEDRLAVALANARRSGELIAVLLIDLDNFKSINDTLGHAAGDEVLREAARRIRRHLREGDTVARLGGDEFILLLPQLRTPDNIKAIADRLFETLNAPVRLGRASKKVTASMGIALFPGDGKDIKTLLKKADTAVYRAKEQGRNNYQFS